MDSDLYGDQRQRGLHFLTETLNERVYSSKRSRAGFLGTVTRVRSQIEALFVNTNDEQTVQILNGRLQEACRKFEDSHNSYMSLLTPGCASFRQAADQFILINYTKKRLHCYNVSPFIYIIIQLPVRIIMYLKRVLEILSKVNVYMLKANVHAVSRERRNFPQDRQQKKSEFKQRKQIWPCVCLRNKTVE